MPVDPPRTAPPAPPLAPPPAGARYAGLDAWRGVACLLVLGFHATGAVLTDEHAGVLYGPLWLLEQWGFLGVQLFFVVSGYCIAAAAMATGGPTPTATFLRRRARRIYPTFWAAMAWSAAVGLLVLALARLGVAERRFDPFAAGWHWLSSLALVETALKPFGIDPDYAANGPLWSLCYEVQFYLLVALAFVARSRRVRIAAVVATTLAAIAVRALPALRPRGLVLDLWPDFLCGLWLYARLTGAHHPIPGLALDVGLVAAVLAFVLAFRIAGDGFPQDAKTPLVCLGFAALLVALHPVDARLAGAAPVRALAWVGERSYSLYLTHFPVVMLLAGVARRHDLARGAGVVAVVAAMAGAALGVAACFFRLVERRYVGRPAPAASG